MASRLLRGRDRREQHDRVSGRIPMWREALELLAQSLAPGDVAALEATTGAD
jgi:hypothetical protein